MNHEKAPPAPTSLTLLVEGRRDEQIVRDVLAAAGLPQERVAIRVAGSKYAVATQVRSIPEERIGEHAALVDLDEPSVPDAIARARQQLGSPMIQVFCAVPEIESWLFADDQLALLHCAQEPDVLAKVARLGMPEEIPNPRSLALEVFGPPSEWRFLHLMNVERATSRSPSLRSFLVGLSTRLGVPSDRIRDSVSRNLSRTALASLMFELPGDTIVWRTSSGSAFTAEELRRHIDQGTPEGLQYASDLVRVARDFLRRAAARPATV